MAPPVARPRREAEPRRRPRRAARSRRRSPAERTAARDGASTADLRAPRAQRPRRRGHGGEVAHTQRLERGLEHAGRERRDREPVARFGRATSGTTSCACKRAAKARAARAGQRDDPRRRPRSARRRGAARRRAARASSTYSESRSESRADTAPPAWSRRHARRTRSSKTVTASISISTPPSRREPRQQQQRLAGRARPPVLRRQQRVEQAECDGRRVVIRARLDGARPRH